MAVYSLEPILHSCSEMAEPGGTGGDTQLDSSAEGYRELPVDVEGLDETDGEAGVGRRRVTQESLTMVCAFLCCFGILG